MKISFDWKSWLVLAASIASVVGPLWLWRFDLQSRALSISSSSSTALTPASPHVAADLRVSLAGRTLEAPYSTIIEISNSGSKPILATDIEGNIDLKVVGESKLVQAQVIDKRPRSLAPTLTTSGQTASVQPLLLNPGDQITVAILTENGKPTLLPRARIAGVPDIESIENSVKTKSPLKPLVNVFAAVLATVSVFMLNLMQQNPQRTFPSAAIVVSSFGTILVSASVAAPIWDEYISSSKLSAIGFALALVLPAAIFSWFLRRVRKPAIRQGN